MVSYDVGLKNSINTPTSLNFEKKKRAVQIIDKPPQDKLNRIYRSQGLIGKLFDNIQGALGIGLSKKRLQNELKQGNIQDIDKKLNQYYDQQKNTSEIAIDTITGISAATGFRLIKKVQTYSHLYTKSAKFEKYSTLVGLGISAVAGMFTKPILKALNNIGTKKEDRKRERTVLKDFGSGLVTGLAAPLMYIHKLGILGFLGINSLTRYAFNKKTDKENSLSNHISNGWIGKASAIGLAGLSAFKFHKRVDVIEKAIAKSKENIKNIQIFKSKFPLSELADLAKTNLQDKQTQSDLINATRRGFFSKWYIKLTAPFSKNPNKKFTKIEFGAKPLKRILFNNKEMIKEKELNGIIKEIEQYNIFYPKMIQAMPSNIEAIAGLIGGNKSLEEILKKQFKKSDNPNWFLRKLEDFTNSRSEYIMKNGIGTLNTFLNNYKSNCPSSRTMKEAQEYVSKTFGAQYKILGEKPLGVGTIAESYLAKDNKTGEEVVIKMIKKWVNKDKLNADHEKMLKSLERVKDKIKPDEYDYQRKLLDELYNAWIKEIDLGLEADAAKTLGKYALNYNTVAPKIVKNNIFVMEKANGVQFDKFAEYLEKNNIKLSQNEAADLLRKYFQVFFEQLLAVPKQGQKVMHADPHAGNIFIDINNKAKPFTFIDTGNVMRFTPEEAIQNVTSHLDYLIGNSKSIAKRLLKGATLPSNMSEEKAVELLSKHLDETFFSGKYKIRTSDPFSAINNESMEFMKKNKVILNFNNTNLLKAEITYLTNLASLSKIAKNIDMNTTIDDKQMEEGMKLMGKQILESIQNGVLNNKKCALKEVYTRYKYLKDNPEQFFTTLYTYVAPKNP